MNSINVLKSNKKNLNEIYDCIDTNFNKNLTKFNRERVKQTDNSTFLFGWKNLQRDD